MWDGADGEPCIYHGGTLTSKISFREVVQAIADYGFKSSPYPIILSFENHCSQPFQLKMANHIKDILLKRGILWLPPESTLSPGGPGQPATKLPSPEEAKGFILIKAKIKRFSKEQEKIDSGQRNSPVVSPTGGAVAEFMAGHDKTGEEKDDLDAPKDKNIEGLDKSKDFEDQEQETINELDDLVAIKGLKLKNLVESVESPQVEIIHSLKESKLNKVIRKSTSKLIAYTAQKLLRTYPDNIRVDSSNFNPMPAWIHGSQLVALNYQTRDVPMW